VNPADIQLDENGKLKHFLSIEGLKKPILQAILDNAKSFISMGERRIKKAPFLRGKTVVNLFFENSTRTRTTFEIAAKRLSADVINLNPRTSSSTKGESLLDTINNLEAMSTDMFVVRHGDSGTASMIAHHVPEHVRIINAGDGQHEHPTQAMLDMFTIQQFKPEMHNLRVAIVGDILHSRVARSQIHALSTLGVAEIRVIAPKTILPTAVETLGVQVFHNMDEGLAGVDVIIMLRVQRERMDGLFLPSEQEYFNLYGLTEKRLKLAAPDAIVMHPGPINRGLEIDSAVADCKQSVILAQVTNGIAVRMSIMAMVMASGAAGPGEAG